MSTTKVKSLREIQRNLDLMPGRVFSIRDAEICIYSLCEALESLMEYIESETQKAFYKGTNKGLHMMDERWKERMKALGLENLPEVGEYHISITEGEPDAD